MIHPDLRLKFIHEDVGFGLVAARDLPMGTITWVRDPLDRAMTVAEFDAMPEPLRASVERYAFYVPSGDLVLCWDIARFQNHCCEPNTLVAGAGFDLAIRDIREGEHVTTDYAALISDAEAPFRCGCGAPSCRGEVSRADLAAHRARYAAALTAAAARADAVPQRLASLLTEAPVQAVAARWGG